MLKRVVIILCSVFLLSACSFKSVTKIATDFLDSFIDEEDSNETEVNMDVETAEVLTTESESEVAVEEMPTDLEGVLHKMKEALTALDSVTFTGQFVSDSVTTPDENISVANMPVFVAREVNESYDLNSEIILNPFVQHVSYMKTSKDGLDKETYHVNGMNYEKTSIDDVFEIKTEDESTILPAMFTPDELDQLLINNENFTLTDQEDTFLISYSGPDDAFKQSVYAFIAKADKLGGEKKEIYEHAEIFNGSMEMIISKDTFHLLEKTIAFEAKIDYVAAEIETHNEYEFVFTNHNLIDHIDIPAEIMND